MTTRSLICYDFLQKSKISASWCKLYENFDCFTCILKWNLALSYLTERSGTKYLSDCPRTFVYFLSSPSSAYLKRKRKRSDSVLWQKPLHQQKCQKGKVTTQTTPQKSSIKQRLRTDLGRSVGVTTATQLVWFTGLEHMFKLSAYCIYLREDICRSSSFLCSFHGTLKTCVSIRAIQRVVRRWRFGWVALRNVRLQHRAYSMLITRLYKTYMLKIAHRGVVDWNYFLYDYKMQTYWSHGAPCSTQYLIPWKWKYIIHVCMNDAYSVL